MQLRLECLNLADCCTLNAYVAAQARAKDVIGMLGKDADVCKSPDVLSMSHRILYQFCL